jgi:chorismate dehydratase
MKLKKLRVSIVEFLNTAPLVWGFTDGPLAGPFADKYELSFAVPSQCAEALKRGDVDIAIIPAIEYQRIDNTVVLPGLAVAVDGEVRSLLLVSKRPIERAQRIALDTSSRATVALVKILASQYWKIHPEFVDAPPNPVEMLKDADAAMIIGDPALRISIEMEQLSRKAAARKPGEGCCGCDESADLPIPGYETLYIYDLAHEWREMTGKPCVMAMWVGRKDVITPEVVADFKASKEYGVQRVRDIAEGASMKLELPVAELERYLTENVRFDLTGECLAGLNLYFQKAAELGLIPRNKPIEFAAASPAPAVPEPTRP